MTNEDATYGWRKSFRYVAKRQNGVQEQVRILPDPLASERLVPVVRGSLDTTINVLASCSRIEGPAKRTSSVCPTRACVTAGETDLLATHITGDIMLIHTTPDGKQWEVVGVGRPTHGDWYIAPVNEVKQFFSSELSIYTYAIVRPIVPEWITPTDEHAKQRPMVEVRDSENGMWETRTLVYVTPLSCKYPFQTVNDDHKMYSWRFCRMRNPEYKEQP